MKNFLYKLLPSWTQIVFVVFFLMLAGITFVYELGRGARCAISFGCGSGTSIIDLAEVFLLWPIILGVKITDRDNIYGLVLGEFVYFWCLTTFAKIYFSNIKLVSKIQEHPESKRTEATKVLVKGFLILLMIVCLIVLVGVLPYRS